MVDGLLSVHWAPDTKVAILKTVINNSVFIGKLFCDLRLMVNIGFEMFTEVKARFDLMECYYPIKLQRLEGQNRIDVADLWGAKGS